MSWASIETTLRASAESLRGDVPNLMWLAAVQAKPSGAHVTYAMLMESTVPMEIGANNYIDPMPDRTTGRMQFDVYLPAGESIAVATDAADTIRSHFRGLRLGGIYFETPQMTFLGRDGGLFRWVVDCPFIAEEM